MLSGIITFRRYHFGRWRDYAFGGLALLDGGAVGAFNVGGLSVGASCSGASGGLNTALRVIPRITFRHSALGCWRLWSKHGHDCAGGSAVAGSDIHALPPPCSQGALCLFWQSPQHVLTRNCTTCEGGLMVLHFRPCSRPCRLLCRVCCGGRALLRICTQHCKNCNGVICGFYW